MKKITLILLVLLPIFETIQADVIRVNNQLPTNHQERIFQSLQEAHNFAKSGDTLMVEGSPTIYSALTISKRLVIFGTGYFLDENFETPSNKLVSRILRITCDPGSEGSILLGLTLTTNSAAGNININTDNIIVMRCYIPYTGAATISLSGNRQNIQILQNFIGGYGLAGSSNQATFSNVIFNNNIVGSLPIGSNLDRVFTEVNNNVFLGSHTNILNLRTNSFRNNIIVSNSTNITIASTSIQNNLTLSNQITGNGNQIFDPNQLFIGSGGNSTDGQYQIKSDSPYIASGFQGAEPGAFGGNTPYILSGLPPLPIIFDLSADSFGTQQNGLNVSIKAKTNN